MEVGNGIRDTPQFRPNNRESGWGEKAKCGLRVMRVYIKERFQPEDAELFLPENAHELCEQNGMQVRKDGDRKGYPSNDTFPNQKQYFLQLRCTYKEKQGYKDFRQQYDDASDMLLDGPLTRENKEKFCNIFDRDLLGDGEMRPRLSNNVNYSNVKFMLNSLCGPLSSDGSESVEEDEGAKKWLWTRLNDQCGSK